MCKFAYDFSTDIPLTLSIIYGKDPDFKGIEGYFKVLYIV